MSTKNSYGTCQCGEDFRIPGLEQSLCARCGWVRTPKPEKPKAVVEKPIREIEVKLKSRLAEPVTLPRQSHQQLNLLGGDL